MKLKRIQQGLSVVELMVAATIGLFLIATVGNIFLMNKRSFTQNDQTTFIQANGRYAINTLIEDLAAVDFWGGMTDPETITSTASDLALSGTACGSAAGWTYATVVTLSYLFEPSSSTVSATFPCITAFSANTNLLLTKRVRGRSETALTNDNVYLRTNGTVGRFFKQDSSDAAKASGESDWQYWVHLYYINSTQLQRKSLIGGTSPSMASETVAEGIEYFHVEFGLDTNGDNSADFYSSSPSNAEIEHAVSARVYILVRGDREVTGYENNKTYHLGDKELGPYGDGYYRRVFFASTPLRNMMSTRQFGES